MFSESLFLSFAVSANSTEWRNKGYDWHNKHTARGLKKKRSSFHTFNRFWYKMWWGLGFLHSVPLHNLTFFIESQKPCSAWFLLTVQCRRIDHIVVFKHRFLKFAFRSENILWKKGRYKRKDFKMSQQMLKSNEPEMQVLCYEQMRGN